MKTLDSNDRRGKFHQTFKKQITPNQTVPGNREKKKKLFSNWYKANVTLMRKSDKIVNKEK